MWGVAWLWAAVALSPHAAQAAEITWASSGDCQNSELATAQVEKLVGQSLAEIDWIDFEVEVAVGEGGAYRLVLRTLAEGSAPREREIVGASCNEVTDAVSVAIALTISERERAAEPEPIGERPSPPPSPDAVSVPEAASQPAAPEPPHVAIGAGLLVASGALPSLAPGAQVTGALEWKALRIGVFLAVLVPQEAQLPDDRGGTFDLVLGGVDLCAKPELATLHLVACAGFELGRMGGRGDNVADPRLGDAGWYAPRVELGVGFGVADPLRVWLRGGVAVPLSRPEFLLDETDRVHQASNMSFRGLLAVEILL